MTAKLFFVIFLNVIYENICGQITLFPSYNLGFQIYNPAYTGNDNKYSIGAVFGYSYDGRAPSENFRMHDRGTNTDLPESSDYGNLNYNGYFVAIPVRLKTGNRIGIGLSYINNDLNRVETVNSMIFSLAFNQKLGKGRLSYGINLKRNTVLASANRIFFAYQSTINYPLFTDYKQITAAYDLGILYGNEEGTFDFGLCFANTNQVTYSVNSTDLRYSFYYSTIPQVILNANYIAQFGKDLSLVNNGVLMSNGEHSDYLLRTMFRWKSFAVGPEFMHRTTPHLGTAVSYSNKMVDILYSYTFSTESIFIYSGFHEFGFKFKV